MCKLNYRTFEIFPQYNINFMRSHAVGVTDQDR